MRRTLPIATLFLTVLFLAAEPLGATAQRGRTGTGSAGASSARSGVAASSAQRGSSRGSSRGSVGGSRGSSRGSIGGSRGSVGSSRSYSRGSSRSSSSGVTRITRTTTRSSSTPTVRYVTPDTTRRASTTRVTTGATDGTRGTGSVVVPTREVAPPPLGTTPSEPTPSGLRRDSVLPSPIDREVLTPVRTLPRAPVPAPYRGSAPVERPTDPASLRAVDRYRDSVESGEWERVRSRLSDGASLRGTTTRNLDQLIDRYRRGTLTDRSREGEESALRGRPRDAYRFDYGRGPLDRLSRPNAERDESAAPARGRLAGQDDDGFRAAAERLANAEDEGSRAAAERLAKRTTRARRRLADGDGSASRSLLDRPAVRERLLPRSVRGDREPLEADAPGRRALDGLSRLARSEPEAARRLADAGRRLADVTRASNGLVTRATVGAGAADLIGRGLTATPPGYADDPVPYWDDCYWDPGLYGGFYCGPFGYGFGFGCSPFFFGCGPYLWNPYWCNYPGAWSAYWWGYPFGYSWCAPMVWTSSLWWGAYGGFSPGFGGVGLAGGTTVIVEEQPVIIVEQAPATTVVADPGALGAPASGTVVVPAPAGPGGGGGQAGADEPGPSDPVSGAADTYLTLGDRAFREARYADAVHFYAKAVELEPEVGVFSLVLSDALFATGDYGYAAFALRRALELEPALIESEVDKRSFYSDPREFDRQLATLELYLEDHPADDDARLVLAANLLFSGAPAAAVDLLQSPLADGLDADQAAGLVLARALETQYGR